jgi:hypothetical protein
MAESERDAYFKALNQLDPTNREQSFRTTLNFVFIYLTRRVTPESTIQIRQRLK